MTWEDKGKQLVEILKPVYNPKQELNIFKSIISSLYLQNMSIDDAEKLIITLYDNLPSHGVERTEIFKLQDDIFLEEKKPNHGLKSLKKELHLQVGDNVAQKAVKKIERVIVPDKFIKNQFVLSDNTWIEIDTFNNMVNYQTMTTVKNEDFTSTTRILLCRPYKVIVHVDPLSNGKREFTITWKTVNDNYFITDSVTQSEIEQMLYESGFVINSKYLKTAITAVIQIFIDNGMAEVHDEVESAGFYYNNQTNSLDKVGYTVKPNEIIGVKDSLSVIHDLKNYFKGNEDKLATTLKHGLVAPFGFAKKQMGLPLEYLIPYLYHFGKGGSGKTTIARIGLWFYHPPETDVNDIGGTEFDTVPRMGEQLRKSTFGLIVNEPEGCFEKKSCVASLKTSAERTNARQKIVGNRMEHILALAMVSFASNVPLPAVEGLSRRVLQLLYSYNEKKTDEEKEIFMKHFKLNDPLNCEFRKLQNLGNFAVNVVDEDIDLLKLPWKEFANEIIVRAYEYCGMSVPDWLLGYVESVTSEDLDDEETESIRMFLVNEVNRSSGQIKLYSADDGGRPLSQEHFFSDEVKGSEDFEDKVWNVVNEGLLPYVVTRENKGVRELCFLSGFKKVLNDNNIPCYSLESTGELLGWKHGYLKINGKSNRCLRVNFRIFLGFLYPTLVEESE